MLSMCYNVQKIVKRHCHDANDTGRKNQAIETRKRLFPNLNVPKNGRCQLNDLELFERFKEVERMDSENRKMIVNLIDAVIIKTKVQQAIKPASGLPWEERMQQTLAD